MRIIRAREQVEMLLPWRTAAVNQGLVDQLHGEFHDWVAKSGVGNQEFSARGPVGNWPTVEKFLSDRYPAAHRGYKDGYGSARAEGAGQLLDAPHASSKPPYESGPEAHAQHGYDPAEIAAGMLLLHNGSDPLRGDLAQHDQDRLTDIFNKRQKMQRDYEQRQQGGAW